MSHPMIRRVLAGLALAAFLGAVPAQAAGFGRPAGAADLWALAWSWMGRLWGGEVAESRAPQQGATMTTQKQLPGSGSETNNGGDSTDPATGDKGMGIDPDG